jgi:hypothetical protein
VVAFSEPPSEATWLENASNPLMQRANQREQLPRRIEIKLNPPRQPRAQ